MLDASISYKAWQKAQEHKVLLGKIRAHSRQEFGNFAGVPRAI